MSSTVGIKWEGVVGEERKITVYELSPQNLKSKIRKFSAVSELLTLCESTFASILLLSENELTP